MVMVLGTTERDKIKRACVCQFCSWALCISCIVELGGRGATSPLFFSDGSEPAPPLQRGPEVIHQDSRYGLNITCLPLLVTMR